MDGRPTVKDGGIEEITLNLNESHDQWCNKEDAKGVVRLGAPCFPPLKGSNTFHVDDDG